MKTPAVVRLLLGPLGISLLTACATPTRSGDPGAFTLLQSGQIASAQVHVFRDCVMDGFNDANGNIFWRTSVRQQKRADGYRVETFDDSSAALMMSADVLDSGSVSLYESSTAALVSTSKEREAFARCLAKLPK